VLGAIRVVGGILLAALVLSCRRAEATHPTAPPATESPEAIHGQELYARMCAVCHGASGEGYVADQAPRLAHADFLASASDDYLRAAITNGRTGTTMSAWARVRGGPLTPADVNAVVRFMRGWQKGPSTRLDERPLVGDAPAGAQLYTTHCASCHGAQGVGGPQLHVAGPELLASASNGFLRYAIVRGRPGTPMPAFDATLGRRGVEDVVAALRSFQPALAEARTGLRAPPIPLGPVPLNPKGPEPHGFAEYPNMTPADVVNMELMRGARFAILDARAPSDFMREHIAGAVSVPFYDPAPYFAALPKDVWLVCYCGCPHAESGQLAQQLGAHGFKKVTVLDEGLGVWKSRHYPMAAIERPTEPQPAGH
jgi:cytochrome c oxidase cbb3-type subunit 3/ubiquinol-cytochrome c reductase cytochrome c subunit